MSLSSVIDISRSSLATASELTAITSRNVANANNAGTTRKIAELVTNSGGGARVAQVTRATVDGLRDVVIGASSDSAKLDAISAALDRLDLTGGQSDAASPASKLAALKASLQAYSSNTADQVAAGSVVSAATNLVSTLHEWSQNTLSVRQQADSDIRAAAADLNTKLKQVADLNGAIVNGTVSGADVTDQLDQRDALLSDISEQIGLTVVERGNNSIALYTDSGITLLDGQPRKISVQTVPIADGAPGGAILIDGVPALGSNAIMPISSGRLAGLVEVRDEIGITFGAQLDDIATSVVRAFRETDQGTPATQPDAAGFFTSALLTSVPAEGSSVPGLARSIAVNANVDPARGGDLMRLRDGSISTPGNAAYSYNSSGATAFNDRILQLVSALGESEAHDPATMLTDSASVSDFASNSIGWLQDQRKTTSENANYADTLLQRSQGTLSKAGGINIDEEMSNLLGLERNYQASAKLISTVDSMFGALMQAIG